ncbi:hypothetical protein AAVH_07765 [Aphelenchoides avenae]|nr:hypothetical protein AAVH_07765 [Aphelenchus avenae]
MDPDNCGTLHVVWNIGAQTYAGEVAVSITPSTSSQRGSVTVEVLSLTCMGSGCRLVLHIHFDRTGQSDPPPQECLGGCQEDIPPAVDISEEGNLVISLDFTTPAAPKPYTVFFVTYQKFLPTLNPAPSPSTCWIPSADFDSCICCTDTMVHVHPCPALPYTCNSVTIHVTGAITYCSCPITATMYATADPTRNSVYFTIEDLQLASDNYVIISAANTWTTTTNCTDLGVVCTLTLPDGAGTFALFVTIAVFTNADRSSQTTEQIAVVEYVDYSTSLQKSGDCEAHNLDIHYFHNLDHVHVDFILIIYGNFHDHEDTVYANYDCLFHYFFCYYKDYFYYTNNYYKCRFIMCSGRYHDLF